MNKILLEQWLRELSILSDYNVKIPAGDVLQKLNAVMNQSEIIEYGD